MKPSLSNDDIQYYVNRLASIVPEPRVNNPCETQLVLLKLLKHMETGLQASFQSVDQLEFIETFEGFMEEAENLVRRVYPV